MKFVADDGTVFDTMEECQEYEKNNNTSYVKELIQKYITMYDSLGRELTLDTPIDLDEVNHIFLNDACYVKINNFTNEDEKRALYDYFVEEYGTDFPHYSGIWRYDESDYEWYRLTDEIDKFMRHWKALLKNIRIFKCDKL